MVFLWCVLLKGPPFARLSRVSVSPDNVTEFQQMYKNVVRPVLQVIELNRYLSPRPKAVCVNVICLAVGIVASFLHEGKPRLSAGLDLAWTFDWPGIHVNKFCRSDMDFTDLMNLYTPNPQMLSISMWRDEASALAVSREDAYQNAMGNLQRWES